jgi:hypothetical protein
MSSAKVQILPLRRAPTATGAVTSKEKSPTSSSDSQGSTSKRPRASKPKVRTGCLTCKIRRVSCTVLEAEACLLRCYLPTFHHNPQFAPLTFLRRLNVTKPSPPVSNAPLLDVRVMATFCLLLGEPGTKLLSSEPIHCPSLRKVCLYSPSRLPRASCERWSTFA